MASIAVLPILIGLAVDYAIQLQARFDEATSAGLDGEAAARRGSRRGGPTIATACLATIAGFLALLLSPTPMVRSFGLLLVVGVAIAFGLAAHSRLRGLDALPLRRRVAEVEGGRGPTVGSTAGPLRPPTGPACLSAWRPVGTANPRRSWASAWRWPSSAGALGTQIETVSDVRELAPQSIREVRDLNELQDATGVSGELDVRVEAPDLTDPATLRVDGGVQAPGPARERVLRAQPELQGGRSLPGPGALGLRRRRGGRAAARRRPGGALANCPPTTCARSPRSIPRPAFPGQVGAAQLRDPRPVAGGPAGADRAHPRRDRRARRPGGPPAGVEVELAGLPVIAAAAADDLSSSRYWLTLAGLLAVGARPPRRLPLGDAGRWCRWCRWCWRAAGRRSCSGPAGSRSTRCRRRSAALTIAIATEFSVILAARFHEERGAGRAVAEALRSAYARTGAAVLASGVTATAGFAVLIASDVRMLRDFGFVTVIDLIVALLGVMVALPAALAWSEER